MVKEDDVLAALDKPMAVYALQRLLDPDRPPMSGPVAMLVYERRLR